MKSRAAVAFGPGQPLQIVEVDVAPPKKGEVLIKISHTGVIQTHLLYLAMILKAFFRLFSGMKVLVLSLRWVKA